MHSYQHTLTAEELRKDANPHATPMEGLYEDAPATEGLESARKDISREVKINGVKKRLPWNMKATGCDLSLISLKDKETISEEKKKEAQDNNRPILIQKGGKFILYGNPGDGNWIETPIEPSSLARLNELPFDKGIIQHDDPLLNGQLIDALKGGHARLAGFDKIIEEELGITPEQINVSYSQNLMSLLMHPLNYNNEIGLGAGRAYSPVNLDTDLYRDTENNQVYFRATVEGYTAQEQSTGRPSAVINGPVEVLYKLENGIFKLQHIKTDSDFIRDAFLGKTGLENQLKSIVEPQMTFAILQEIEKILLPPPPLSSEATKRHFFSILTLAGQHQRGEKSANDLVDALEAAKSSVQNEAQRKQSFIKRAVMGSKEKSPAVQCLEKAIVEAKKLPGYIPLANKAASVNEKTAAANDATQSTEGPAVRIHTGKPNAA